MTKKLYATTAHQGSPILIAYPRPTKMVKRNERDNWSTSLAEINRLEYDYVKLHRLSASFEIDPTSFRWLHMGFNGALILPALPELHPIEKSVELFNKFIGNLLLGGVYYDAVGPYDIDRGVLYETGYFRGFGISHDPFALIQALLQTKMAGPLHTIGLLHPMFIESSELHKAYQTGRKVTESINNLSAELVLKGVSAFIERSWVEALSNLWICVEQIVSQLWETAFVSKADDLEQEILGRKDFLKDNRTWTTATKVEMLFNKDIINAETYALLNMARKARNDLVHKGAIPKMEDTEAVFDAIFKLISWIVYGSINHMDLILSKYKQMGPVEKQEIVPPIPVDQMEGVWLGPMPSIPGEKEWGEKEYEKVYGIT